MAEARPGWYPDPSGDPTLLRWWDGAQWTEHCAPVSLGTQERDARPDDVRPDDVRYDQPGQVSYDQDNYGQTDFAYDDSGRRGFDRADRRRPDDRPGPSTHAQPPYGQYQYPPYAPQSPYATNQQYAMNPPHHPYPPYASTPYGAPVITETDRNLRLAAFVLNVITLAAAGWLLIPLAWMIPMTVRSWNIYKGVRPNTVAFGVCNLVFFNAIAGVLLLISAKDV